MRCTVISTWFEKFLKTYIILMLLLMVIAACYFDVYDRSIRSFAKAELLLAALILAGGFSFVSVKIFIKNKLYFYTFVILLSVVSCSFWNLFADTQPVSDYEVLIDAGN